MDSDSQNKETNSSPERSNSGSSKRLKSCSVEDLSKEDLICRVKQLEAHVTQLKNIIAKSESKKTAEWKSKRPFDFSRYSTRHIALKLLYLGWDYHGFAVQEDSDRTIEAALFDALTKAKLVQNRESSNYHRCGRTDKGVSAFSQVISIDVRSNLTEGVGVKVGEDGSTNQNKSNSKDEIRYVRVLNKLLPPEIRILAWAPVPADFSARFDCQQRTYKYFFPRGNLKIDLMLEAGHKLLGEHDYRNFCKMDVAHGVVNFVRNISSLTITEDSQSEGSEYNMCEMTVTGKAFLWHQIRCVVAVLFLVGKGKESPQIVDELLDVERYPSRPQYTMAADLPLVLFDCEFENLEWIYDAETHGYNIRDLKHIWGRSAIKAAMTRRMLKELDTVTAPPDDNSVGPRGDNFLDWLSPSWHGKTYRPLLARQTCDSLEDKMESAAKKRKFNEASKNSGDG